MQGLLLEGQRNIICTYISANIENIYYIRKDCIIAFNYNHIKKLKNSQIHTLKKLFHFVGSTQRLKGKNQTFSSFMQQTLSATFDEISLNLIDSLDVWVVPKPILDVK